MKTKLLKIPRGYRMLTPTEKITPDCYVNSKGNAKFIPDSWYQEKCKEGLRPAGFIQAISLVGQTPKQNTLLIFIKPKKSVALTSTDSLVSGTEPASVGSCQEQI